MVVVLVGMCSGKDDFYEGFANKSAARQLVVAMLHAGEGPSTDMGLKSGRVPLITDSTVCDLRM